MMNHIISAYLTNGDLFFFILIKLRTCLEQGQQQKLIIVPIEADSATALPTRVVVYLLPYMV